MVRLGDRVEILGFLMSLSAVFFSFFSFWVLKVKFRGVLSMYALHRKYLETGSLILSYSMCIKESKARRRHPRI